MAALIPRWWQRWRQKSVPHAKSLPPGQLAYAIGDVHGRLDLLQALLAQIDADRRAYPEAACQLVMLGDYVDRGPDSRGVLDCLIALQDQGDMQLVCLLGNHEELLLQFLEASDEGLVWLRNGGAATLASYGVAIPDTELQHLSALPLEQMRRDFQMLFPRAHRQFLRGLKLCHQVGDYLFVHAGLKPGVAIDKQDPNHLIWIRDPFLTHKRGFGPIVVHGHSVRTEAEFFPTPDAPVRIGIDTGAWMSGTLTALALQNEDRRLLQTAG